jgi:hypothetical protein
LCTAIPKAGTWEVVPGRFNKSLIKNSEEHFIKVENVDGLYLNSFLINNSKYFI